MDQSSPLPKNPDRGEPSLVRRLLRALGKTPPSARRPIARCDIVPVEALEVRQVLSGRPFVALALPDGHQNPHDAVVLSAEDYAFISDTVQQVSSTLQGLGWGHKVDTSSVTGDEVAIPPKDRGLIEPVNGGDALPPEFREDPANHDDPEPFGPPFEHVIDDIVPHEAGIGSGENTDDSFSEVIIPDVVVDSIAMPDVAGLPDPPVPLVERSLQDGNQAPLPPAPPSVLQVGPPRDLRVEFRFDWNGTKHGLEIERPDDSTLLITIRGPEGAVIPEARRQMLQDSISKATVELVQNIAPGASVQISLFAASTPTPEMLWEAAGVVAETIVDAVATAQATGSTTESDRTASNVSLSSSLSKLASDSQPRLRSNPLDIVFENVGSLLFTDAISEAISPWIPPLSTTSSDKYPAEIIVDRTVSLIPANDIVNTAISNPESSQLMQVTRGESSLTLLKMAAIGLAPPQESEQTPVPADLRQTTRSTSILKLLFAEPETNDIGSDLVSSGTPLTNPGSQSTTAESGAAQTKRQRQPQRDSSAAISWWRNSDNEQPPIPTSDGSPREIQFVDRSRGPPLLRSARDDLLTDYEAPAGLLERLRYSISPRGPSLVTVDVQLPETLVLFGAES